jgi:23S rRNA (guanosine2251-2'-O)-methyltransferase
MFNMVNAIMAKHKSQPPRRTKSGRANVPSNGHSRAPSRAPKRGEYWIYGTHAALAALANPERRKSRVLATAGFLEAYPDVAGISDVEVVKRAALDDELPEGAVHQGIAVSSLPLPGLDLEDVLGGLDTATNICVAVLDQASDPRNIGAVLRSAAAFGVSCVIVQDRHAPPETGAMAKAASGALEHVAVIRAVNLARTLGELKDRGFWCVGLDGSADDVLSETRLDGPTALVFGAEGRGLRRLTRETCDILAKIPLSENVESLNLANAVSVALYEWAR